MRLKVWDPYRGKETTLGEFARAEGSKKMSAYFFYKRHGTLEGYRDRPVHKKVRTPSTYTYKGKPVGIKEAAKRFGIPQKTMTECRKEGITDIEKIAEIAARKKNAWIARYPADGGRMVTATEFARENGVSRQGIYYYLHRHGNSLVGFAERSPRYKPGRRLYPADGDRMVSIREFAKEKGVTKMTVYHYLHRHGNSLVGFDGRRRHWMGRPKKTTGADKEGRNG